MEILMQLHGGGGGSSQPSVKQSAPGSSQAPSIDSATEGERKRISERLANAKGRRYTNKTDGQSSMIETVKKALLGE